MKYINEYNSFEKNLFSQTNYRPEIFIFNLIKDLEIRYDDEKHPYKTFFVDKDSERFWMINDVEIGNLWVSDEHIWSVIKKKFSYNDQKIRKLIKHTVEIVFKRSVETPIIHPFI